MSSRSFGVLILVVLCLRFAQICKVSSSQCSKIYILPLFAEDTDCRKVMGGHETCIRWLGNLFYSCAYASQNRQLITVFNFNYSTTFTCLINKIFNSCHQEYNAGNNITLGLNKHFGVWSQFTKQIEKDKKNNCINNSLAIFVTDIPHQQFYLYPDIDSIFGFNLNKTLDYLYKEKLHAYAVWLNTEDDKIINQPNEDVRNLTSFTGTKYMQLRYITYVKFFDSEGGDLCAIESFPEFSDYTPTQHNSTLQLIIGIVSGVILLLIFLFIAFWSRQIYRRWKESKIEAFADAHARSARHLLFGKYHDEWEVTPKELKVDAGTVLGKGAFGVVYKGHLKKQRDREWIEMDVAVKFTTEHSTEAMRQDMINEIGFMKALGSHENLLVMVGYVKSIENPVICTVFCSNGDLLGILQKHPLHFMSPNKCSEVEICLLLSDLLKISIEVCSGLVYLSSLNYVHRDIAARNVLLTDKMVAKLGDFGLCKQLEDGHDFLIDKEGKFPIKYMPYECITMGQFSTKSDVWSFGILIWEMFSGGRRPFDGMEFNEFVNFLNEDGKLEFTEETPQQITQLLNDKVFKKDPLERCHFTEFKQDLSNFYSVVSLVEERNNVGVKKLRRFVRKRL